MTFLARNTDKTKPKQQVPVKLSGVKFTRRWPLQILPKSFTKTRCYGGYGSRYRSDFIAPCNQLQRHDFYVYGLLRSDWPTAQQPFGADKARR